MKIFRSLILCIIFSTAGGFAHAQKGEVAKLETVTKEMLDVLYDATYESYSYEQQESAIRSILEENYDVMVLIRRAMARNWNLLSTEEQAQVQELVIKLIVKAYIEGLRSLGRPTIQYGDLITITEKRFEIPAMVTFSDGKVFNLVYRFGRLKSGWQIYDILAEDVSIISNYRQQFDDHFRKGTGAELIEKLEKFLEEKTVDENTKP